MLVGFLFSNSVIVYKFKSCTIFVYVFCVCLSPTNLCEMENYYEGCIQKIDQFKCSNLVGEFFCVNILFFFSFSFFLVLWDFHSAKGYIISFPMPNVGMFDAGIVLVFLSKAKHLNFYQLWKSAVIRDYFFSSYFTLYSVHYFNAQKY